MKRFLILALTVVLVFAFAAVAMADVNISGEFRVRGANNNNTADGDDSLNDRQHYIDQRMRLWVTANVADDVTIKTRFTTSNGTWNGAKNTGGTAQTTDYAWIVIKKWDTTFSIGRQAASWGHKALTWGTPKDRAVITRKAGDIVYGFIYQKDSETAATATGTSDQDEYMVLVKAPIGDHKINALLIKVLNHQSDLDGMAYDVSYDGKAGPVSIFAEYASKSGDLLETATGDNPGFMLAGVAGKFGPVNAHVAYAAASNTFVADDDFTPTLAFGKSQATAISNFGDTHDGVGDDTVSAIVLGAKMGIGDDLALGLNFATGTLSDNDASGNSDVTEIDLYMTYNLATKTSFKAGLAQVDIDGNTDPIMTTGWQIDTKF